MVEEGAGTMDCVASGRSRIGGSKGWGTVRLSGEAVLYLWGGWGTRARVAVSWTGRQTPERAVGRLRN